MKKPLCTCALSLALLPTLSAAAEAPAAAPGAIDVAPVRDRLVLLTDGKSHYVAALSFPLRRQLSFDQALFYGDGKRFFYVPIQGGSQNGEQWSYNFSEPRLTEGGREEGSGDLRFEPPAKYVVWCGQRKTELQVVDAAKAQPMLAAATFERGPRKYRPYALVRDSKGRYYYVDRGTTKETAKQFRVFLGPKGNLKQQKLTNIVSDSEGDVFSTKTGNLRLVLGKGQAMWLQKGAPQEQLVIIPTDFNTNVAMIYNELGVYSSERLGTPCDDM